VLVTQALHRVRTPDRPCVDGLDRPARIQRLSAPRETAFWIVAYIFAVTILGTSLPAPLYAIYQRHWHFSAAVLTLIFAAYAVAVLVTLLVAGRASDQAGRKPVMAVALGFSALSTVVFILAPSLGWLYLGRVLSGLSAGLMTGAAPAALTEMLQASDSRRSSMVATAANMGGAGLGPLIAGLFAEYLPQPTVLVFEAYLGLLVIAGLTLAFVPETVTNRQRLSLRLTGLAMPREGRGEFIAAGLAAFAAFALTGLFTSLAPGFVGGVLHQVNFAVAGTVSFLIFAAALVAQLGLARANSRPVMLTGLGLFLVGLALVVTGMATNSLGWFLAGDVVGGIAVGALFIGSMSTASRLAPPERRAEIISAYFVFAYSGLIIPVVGVGVAADYVGNFRATLGCSIGLAALCLWSAAVVSGRSRTGARGRPRPGPRPN
jgi:MFS family permease